MLMLGFLTLSFLIVAFTSFSKVYVCLQGLKIAFTQGELLPAFVLLVLSLLISILLMYPVFEDFLSTPEDQALIENMIRQGSMNQDQELQIKARINQLLPRLKAFLERNTDPHIQSEMKRIFARKGAHQDTAHQDHLRSDLPIIYLSFSFLISEMYQAFYFILWLLIPFLLIDLMVAYLLSIFQIQLQTTHLSLPLKILLFLQIDGWLLLTEKLKLSYQII
jgi:flagellar biosynthetic protein FliP